jgi:hypothetical protein
MKHKSNLPNFLLVGPGRTGTTWVTKNLMLHPQVFLPRRKSTRFFMDNYDKGLTWYMSHFEGRNEQAVGEASVGYFAHPDAPPRIQQLLPDIKLVATFRDPVDRAYSEMCLIRSLARRGDPNLTIDFEEKLEQTPRIVDQGKYAKHLARLFALFPPENILVLFYETMREAPDDFLRRVYRFVGVDESFSSPLVTQQINSSATRLAESRLKKLLYRVVLRLDLFALSRRLDASMRAQIAPLDNKVRMRVLDRYYRADIEELERMLDVRLPSWKSPKAEGEAPAPKASGAPPVPMPRL